MRNPAELNPAQVAVVIPCFRAKGLVGPVVAGVLRVGEELGNYYQLLVLVVNDACPEESWHEITGHPQVQVLHHSHNRGVGAATLTGLQAALEQQCQAMVKLDADGQHPPLYLLDLIPHLLGQPAGELALVKGSRYRWPSPPGSIPWARQLGSILLEPMARAALAYRNLTDISNGYLGLNQLSCRYLMAAQLGPSLQQRYLFESSVLVRSAWLGLELREFAMLPRYGERWISSMESGAMVLPLLGFWSQATLSRLLRCYMASVSLGSGLLLMTALSSALAGYLWITRVGPEIADRTQVSAGTSSAFTTACATALVSLLLLFLYDYRSGSDVKVLRFPALLRDLEKKQSVD
ncbi:glycosyltransferase family 2 protein [Synechococcus sp. MIT S9508]|uniref:glycosyltransferase family 2 protein n=1 Tax=Synechococcus sp. MIT S9508 TaxID=1801629 RepID=UPI0007BB5098|nr:glycosyltransferase family 2 protein [Synechococcus sp. MIT S9508]KZR90553.1 Undecaprenyl-phosphate mannosyltransferase [Synechococcus sp. MIT S9508]